MPWIPRRALQSVWVLVACILVRTASTRAPRRVGAVSNDAVITAYITPAWRRTPRALAMAVDTANVVGMLTGVLSPARERHRAIHLAPGSNGITQVNGHNVSRHREASVCPSLSRIPIREVL